MNFNQENKDKVLNMANVLLISDIQKDYDELVEYGFKNIDYFKSFIRADQYFDKHPEELEKYHIILFGEQSVLIYQFGYYINLYLDIADIVEIDRPYIVVSYLYKDRDCDCMSGRYELLNFVKNSINLDIESQEYADILDKIVEQILINHTLEKVELKDKNFERIQDYINPNRLPLPTKKSDLKILYLGFVRDGKYVNEIAEKLGLNITFQLDVDFNLGNYVIRNLGDYDIIVSTQSSNNRLGDNYESKGQYIKKCVEYGIPIDSQSSRKLLSANYESTEQCKATGRELALLAIQKDSLSGFDKSLAYGIKLEYTFSGNLAPNYEYHSKEFRVLKESSKEYGQSQNLATEAIIESLVHFYNQALIHMGKSAINDLDFKTSEEFEQDYVKAYTEKEAKRKAKPASISDEEMVKRFSFKKY